NGDVGGNGCGSSPDFTVSFYTDSGGSGPATLITSFVVGAADQTATGNTIGSDPDFLEYSYSTSFALVTLTAGTTYWFTVQETAAEPSGTFGVETTSTAPAGSATYSMGIFPAPPTWHFQPETLAFNLTFTVPEPSTWAMMLLGFAGLGFLGYRRTVKARVAA
ncbi:MAG TPA: PEPxxWA-CTERM sorting domain-containing protein, partial [Roseiarcus sp.]